MVYKTDLRPTSMEYFYIACIFTVSKLNEGFINYWQPRSCTVSRAELLRCCQFSGTLIVIAANAMMASGLIEFCHVFPMEIVRVWECISTALT